MQGAKSFTISKRLVMEGYRKVKANRGACGIDGVSLAAFEKNLKSNLYKIWNRMSSGSYLPPVVKLVEIPKGDGGVRTLGIPTVGDRIAQMVVVQVLEPLIEPHFHADSYGYRPKRSAHDALSVARQRCWKYDWVLDLDISKFFDTISHESLMKALKKHTDNKWVLLYVERWLEVPYEIKDGSQIVRTEGVPQGSVIGPLLANLFLHYAFDQWMKMRHPAIPFERYADDVICHCQSKEQAETLSADIRERLMSCKLSLNEKKTIICYCKDSNRNEEHDVIQFDFLGYTFMPRSAKSQSGKFFTSFTPAISRKAQNRIGKVIWEWRPKYWIGLNLVEIAEKLNPVIQGWINYYGKFHRSVLQNLLRRVNERLALWVRKKFKRFKHRQTKSIYWLGNIAKANPMLFAHWPFGSKPTAGII